MDRQYYLNSQAPTFHYFYGCSFELSTLPLAPRHQFLLPSAPHYLLMTTYIVMGGQQSSSIRIMRIIYFLNHTHVFKRMKPYHTWITLWQKILGLHYYNTLKWYWTWKSKYWNYSEPLQISLRNRRVQSRCFAYVTHNASTEYSRSPTPSPKRSIFADLCNNTRIIRVFYFLTIRTYFNVWYFIIR